MKNSTDNSVLKKSTTKSSKDGQVKSERPKVENSQDINIIDSRQNLQEKTKVHITESDGKSGKKMANGRINKATPSLQVPKSQKLNNKKGKTDSDGHKELLVKKGLQNGEIKETKTRLAVDNKKPQALASSEAVKSGENSSVQNLQTSESEKLKNGENMIICETKTSKAERNKIGEAKKSEEKAKKPLAKQPSKADLDARRRSSGFSKNKKLISKKPERPNAEKLLELCKKGVWLNVEKTLADFGKEEKYEANIADSETGLSPIIYAVKSGKVEMVEKLIAYGFDVNLKDKNGMTALHFAAKLAREDLLRVLLIAKADPMVAGGAKKEYPIHTLLHSMKGPSVGALPMMLKSNPEEMRLVADGDGQIPLMIAVELQQYGICRELLSSGAKQQLEAKRKKLGDTVVHIATRKRDLEMMRLLLDYKVDIDSQNREGQTPLHMVANDADDTWVRFLHNHGANPDVGDAQGRTPLFLMVEKGSFRRVNYMIEKFEASINTRTKDGRTLVHAAAKSSTIELPMMFIKKGIPIKMQDRSGSRAIHVAAQYGHVELIKNLLARGEDVQPCNNDGYSPLHVAVEHGRENVADVLIANRADVNLVSEKWQEKPIHVAARCPSGRNCVSLLIKSGADIDSVNQFGKTPIMIASEAGNLDTLSYLLNHRVDIDLVDQEGENVFAIAIKNCHFQIAKELLTTVKAWRSEEEVKKLVNRRNPIGETSLHHCAKLQPKQAKYENEEKDITKLLLESGGEIVMDNFEKRETPVHYCSGFGTVSVLDEIIKHTANVELPLVVNRPAKNGFTPILYACNHGHVEIIRRLLEHHARVDVFDEKGRAGLHLAAELGHQAIMDVLLESKAFVNVRNKSGMTPLHLAAKNGFTSMVQVLITKYGAQVDPVTLTKQTPLHMAAEHGQLETCRALIQLGTDMKSVDNQNQTPLHLAAQSNHPEVFRLFLEKNPELISTVNSSGQTCAHIAAVKGSVLVIEELLKFDRETVIKSKIENTGSTVLHHAVEKGHSKVVEILLKAGASPIEENKAGMTALHLAAQFGHVKVLRALNSCIDLKMFSKRNGLTALHIAASYGQSDFVGELLAHVPGNIKSQRSTNDLDGETDITPLHLAAKNGHEGVVRILMNSTGVQVDSITKNNESTPMHYAAEGGHMIVAGLLISRSADLLLRKDKHGRSCLHLAAAQGHLHLITMLLGQGADIHALDKKNWTPLHHAARNGHLEVVKLLTEAGADTDALNSDGKNAICLATNASHIDVLNYLLTIEHDSLALMEDRSFLQDLMVCSKNHGNQPIHELIMTADAPIYVAVRLARCFEQLAAREKDKARDFIAASNCCDTLAIELLNIISTNYNTSSLLRAVDLKGVEFLDVLIDLERKNLVSQHAVQKYLSKVWIGRLEWSSTSFFGLFFFFLLCPVSWVYVSSPIYRNRLHQIPVIKFMSYLAAHIFLIVLLCSVLLFPSYSIAYYHCCLPQWNEWLLIIWMLGLLVSDFMNPKDRAGLGNIKMCILYFGFAGILLHVATFVLNLFLSDYSIIFSEFWKVRRADALYVRNQIWAWGMLFSFIDFLNFLTVHPLFGPWGVIIVELIQDVVKFVAVLLIFLAGFTLHICAIYQPVYRSHLNHTFSTVGQSFIYPGKTLEMLTYALLGHVQLDDMPGNHLSPPFAKIFMKIAFGVYMLVTIVVLINLLIAMMSNTYQRIEAKSDIEWKFGRAKLIQNMNRTLSTPSPLNLFIGIPFLLKNRMNNKIKGLDIREKRAKSAKSGIYSQYLDVDNKSAISRRDSRVSIVTAKTLISDDETGRDRKQISKVVNWKAVIKKYKNSHGSIQDDE